MDGFVAREILDYMGNVIGELCLPESTSEMEWEHKLLLQAEASKPKSKTFEQYVSERVDSAVDFGRNLVRSFAKRNVMARLSKEKIAEVAESFKDIQMLLYSGTLTVALDKIVALTPTPEVDEACILEYSNRVRVFLGYPMLKPPVEETSE